MKKQMVFGALFLFTASLLLSQSLVEASKKEQERREKLKGKSAKVVTNADLKAKANTPAIVVTAEEAKPETQGQAGTAPAAGAGAGAVRITRPLCHLGFPGVVSRGKS